MMKSLLSLSTIASSILFLTIMGYSPNANAEPDASALGSLENEVLTISGSIDPLGATAQDINQNMASLQAADSDVIDLSTLPILSDFINESGEVDLPLNTPFSINIVNSFGDYGIGIGQRF